MDFILKNVQILKFYDIFSSFCAPFARPHIKTNYMRLIIEIWINSCSFREREKWICIQYVMWCVFSNPLWFRFPLSVQLFCLVSRRINSLTLTLIVLGDWEEDKKTAIQFFDRILLEIMTSWLLIHGDDVLKRRERKIERNSLQKLLFLLNLAGIQRKFIKII